MSLYSNRSPRRGIMSCASDRISALLTGCKARAFFSSSKAADPECYYCIVFYCCSLTAATYPKSNWDVRLQTKKQEVDRGGGWGIKSMVACPADQYPSIDELLKTHEARMCAEHSLKPNHIPTWYSMKLYLKTRFPEADPLPNRECTVIVVCRHSAACRLFLVYTATLGF